MPKGKPYTERERAATASRIADREFSANEHRINRRQNSRLGEAIDGTIGRIKRPGLKKAKDKAQARLDKAPERAGRQVVTPSFPKLSDMGLNWREIKRNKNGTYTTK